jgi:CheY-like chemotaxis protein
MIKMETPNIAETPASHELKQAAHSSPGLESAVAGARKRLLAVDDEEPLRNLYPRSLGGSYDVTLASDGDEALEIIAATFYDPERRFPVILLDVFMKRVHGNQVYGALRRDYTPKGYHPYVVFLTGNDFGKLREIQKTPDFFEILQKPVNMAELRQKVELGFLEFDLQQACLQSSQKP